MRVVERKEKPVCHEVDGYELIDRNNFVLMRPILC